MNPGCGGADESGLALGRYELLCRIGSGGMAHVYAARARGQGGFERLVAIKLARPGCFDEPDAAALLLDEARLAALIHHPNVVATLDVGRESDGRVWIAMEYIEGGRLADLMRAVWQRDQRLPPAIAQRIALDALRGLDAAHELRDAAGAPLGLVHRDVSPQNVLVGLDGASRLLDFGIAKATVRMTITREGEVKGKLGYMPPEQLTAQSLTRTADLYAAGVVLWESLTRVSLFRGDSEAQTVQRILHEQVDPPSRYAPGVSRALDALVLRALERDPTHRFATAGEMADALEALDPPPASPREVASAVRDLLRDVLAERKASIARAIDAARHRVTRHSGAGMASRRVRVPIVTMVLFGLALGVLAAGVALMHGALTRAGAPSNRSEHASAAGEPSHRAVPAPVPTLGGAPANAGGGADARATPSEQAGRRASGRAAASPGRSRRLRLPGRSKRRDKREPFRPLAP